ncbi:7TM diverse intracellular signaling domain-containing protein, partial [Acinetobacter baumannii]
MPIIVKDSKSLVEYESNRYQLLALYTGAFLFAIAFNIIIFISTRDKLHFWYALYILVALIYLMM